MKKIVPIFAGWVKGGKVLLDLRREFDRYASSFEGKRIQLVLKKYKTQRSIEQNKYYWGVIIKILSEEFGYFPEEIHDALRFKFLRVSGRVLSIAKSTTELTTIEFEIYQEQIRVWALTEHQIKIPLPNEVEI